MAAPIAMHYKYNGNTCETSLLATGDMAMPISKSTASTATVNQINQTQHLGVDTSMFLNANDASAACGRSYE